MLRGFGRKNKAKAVQVVVYRRDKIFATGTRGIGAERFFYSPLATNGETTLDDKITSYEQQLDNYVDQLRSCSIGTDIDPAKAAEVVAHLTIRTAQVRNSFTYGTKQIAEGVATAVLDPAKRWRLLGYHLPKPTGEVKATIEKAYAEGGFRARGIPRKAFFKFMFEGMKEEFKKIDRMKEFEEAVTTLVNKIPDAAASGHRKALLNGLAPEERVAALHTLTWQVLEAPCDVLLPDCVAIEGDDEDKCRSLVFALNASINHVFMPVATRRVLVGSKSRTTHLPEPLCRMLARCSWEYFVALDKTPEFEALVSAIGSATRQFIDAETGKGLDATFRDLAHIDGSRR